MIKITKCLAKVKPKFSKDIMNKLYQTFESPYSLHLDHIISHYLPQWVCGQISENMFFLDLLVQKLFFDKNNWFLPPFYLKSISLLLISAILLYLSTIPSCMSAVGEETSMPETCYYLWWKHFCCFSPSHLMPETFVSPSALCLCLIFFVFVFWPI